MTTFLIILSIAGYLVAGVGVVAAWRCIEPNDWDDDDSGLAVCVILTWAIAGLGLGILWLLQQIFWSFGKLAPYLGDKCIERKGR